MIFQMKISRPFFVSCESTRGQPFTIHEKPVRIKVMGQDGEYIPGTREDYWRSRDRNLRGEYLLAKVDSSRSGIGRGCRPDQGANQIEKNEGLPLCIHHNGDSDLENCALINLLSVWQLKY